jgi:hypothetical protein
MEFVLSSRFRRSVILGGVPSLSHFFDIGRGCVASHIELPYGEEQREMISNRTHNLRKQTLFLNDPLPELRFCASQSGKSVSFNQNPA